jgi:hypothetical protein
MQDVEYVWIDGASWSSWFILMLRRLPVFPQGVDEKFP